MPVMLSKTYDAFIAAGTPEDKAREAAEELAGYERQFAEIKREIAEMRSEVRGEIAGVRGEIIEMRGKVTLVQWMLGVVIAACATLIIRAFG